MKEEKNNLVKKRLILVKALYEHGKKHAHNGTRLDRIIAIHNLDNSIEWLLTCIALKFKIGIQKKNRYMDFYQLWDAISKNKKLPYNGNIFALHTLRNQVQHHTITPSPEDVSRFVSCTNDFIVEVLKKIFTIDYDKLYLSFLIENGDLKAKIIDAEKAFEKKEYSDSINLCMTAFTDVAWGGKGIALPAGKLTSFFGAQEEFRNLINDAYISKTYPDDRLAREVGKALLQLGQSSTCMQFLTLPQKMTFLRIFDMSDNTEVSKKDAQEAIKFVIDVILNWEEIGLIQNKTEEFKGA